MTLPVELTERSAVDTGLNVTPVLLVFNVCVKAADPVVVTEPPRGATWVMGVEVK
ncbi:MAG: hypothetical protein WB383_08020 [Acidimicrobiales bacterium]